MELEKCSGCKSQLKYNNEVDYCKDCLRSFDANIYWTLFGNSDENIIVQDNRITFDTLSREDFNSWILTFNKDGPPDPVKIYPSFCRWIKYKY